MTSGELLTIWLVRVAMLGYLLSLLRRITAAGNFSQLRFARWLWTIGYVFFLLHLLTAFHFVHHWSHAHAFEVTARRTAQTVGVAYGEGVYINYVFMLVWGVDVAWWWSGLQRYENRPRWISWTIQGFMGFIVLNATVVFTLTSIRWWGLAGTILLIATLIRSQRRGTTFNVPDANAESSQS